MAPVVDVIKLFLEEIWISPKLRNGKKLFLMSEPALKYENNASFEQIYTQKLLIAFKMACYCCFSFGGNLDFPEFLQKNIYNINYWGNNCRNILPLKTVVVIKSKQVAQKLPKWRHSKGQ